MDLHSLADSRKFEHSRMVARISGLLAEKMGYPPSEVSLITQAAEFHDIGKIAVSPEILNKPGALTEKEYEIVKTHTLIGYERINEAVEILTAAAVIALEHHEKTNGAGSYFGLSGQAINPMARIVSVADVYDALLSVRPYKKGWLPSEIRAYFIEQAGKQFDNEVVKVLLDSFDDILSLYKNEKPED